MIKVCVFVFVVCVPHFPTLSIVGHLWEHPGLVVHDAYPIHTLFTVYRFTHCSSHKRSLHIVVFVQFNVITGKIKAVDPKTKLRQRQKVCKSFMKHENI